MLYTNCCVSQKSKTIQTHQNGLIYQLLQVSILSWLVCLLMADFMRYVYLTDSRPFLIVKSILLYNPFRMNYLSSLQLQII